MFSQGPNHGESDSQSPEDDAHLTEKWFGFVEDTRHFCGADAVSELTQILRCCCKDLSHLGGCFVSLCSVTDRRVLFV